MCCRAQGGFNRTPQQQDCRDDAYRHNITANQHLITHSAYTEAKSAYTM